MTPPGGVSPELSPAQCPHLECADEALDELAEIFPKMEPPQVESVEQVKDILGAMEEPAPRVGDSEAHEMLDGAAFAGGSKRRSGWSRRWLGRLEVLW